MGTRADFYVSHGEEAEYLGSVAWNGYQWAEQHPNPVADAKNKDEFVQAVIDMLSQRKDSTTPKEGWPWPWKDSTTTDYAYVWDCGRTHVYQWGAPCPVPDDLQISDERKCAWPDMSGIQNVTMGPRSGIIVLTKPQ